MLKGKVFKKKMLSEDKVKGLAAVGFSAYGYMKLTALSLMMGPMLPMSAIAASFVYGMSQFSERNTISEIEALPNGFLKITYLVTPVKTETITCHVNDTLSLCALGDDDLGA